MKKVTFWGLGMEKNSEAGIEKHQFLKFSSNFLT